MTIHVVQPRETIFSIAAQYGISTAQLVRDNELKEQQTLVVGQTLVILFSLVTHEVKAGDTLNAISSQYGISQNQLYRNNPQLRAQNIIVPGDILVISYKQEKVGQMEVNGYVYPFVDKQLLRETLPYLTYIAPFTYGFTVDGNLVDLDDEEIIRMAKDFGVKPLMHLSTLTKEGGFSNELASRALNYPAVQNNLINNILENLSIKGYYGLDIDFEFVLPSDKESYPAFIETVTKRLNAQGYPVMTALAPKTSGEMKGILYEAHDYPKIGAAANIILLMTYEWGYTYGPPMAVSPINSVRAVADYAVTQIDPKKILLGMSNYGYDWTLPFIRGSTKAKGISNIEAIDIARQYGVPILFDESAQAPHFNYYDEKGKQHEVWFEDARSIRARLALVPEYGFRGVGYWTLMKPFPQNWRILNALYEIEQI